MSSIEPVQTRSRAGSNYPAAYSQHLDSTAVLQQDWLSSPILSVPDWPNDYQPSEMYAASPISSPSLYTPSADESWNLFDESFKKSMDITPLSSPTMDTFKFENSYLDYSQNIPQAWNPSWSPGIISQPSALSIPPLSMIYDPSVACDDDAGENTETAINSYQPSEICETPQSPRKAAWGSPTHRRRASTSKTERQSIRSKRRNSSTSEAGSIPKGHQLRSTKQGQRISYAESDVKSDGSKGARTSHNLVEKQYRTRLNGQFSTLLNALPPEVVASEVDGFGRVDTGAEKRVSKAEVLVLARKHIENLERTKRSLECDKKMLQEDVQRLKGAWVKMGGDFIP